MFNFLKKDNVPPLKELKIFGISETRDDWRYFSYYLFRPFGNYLIYKTTNLNDYFEKFKSFGGIYKQFDEENIYRTISGDIFNKFGASLIQSEPDQVDPLYPVEAYGKDYADPQLERIDINGLRCFILHQNKQKLLFLHFSIDEENIQIEINKLVKEQSIDFIFFHKIKRLERSYLSSSEFHKEFPN
jgi:hypothetical protein